MKYKPSSLIQRTAAKEIIDAARYFPALGLLGPRQSGKTTLARALFNQHTYLSLEDPDLRTAALADPRTFLTAHQNPHGIILDEFQQVPSLLSYIQTLIDENQQPGYYILTGSQNFLMNHAITQSLAGRISLHTLLPLSISELDNATLLPENIENILYQGMYPAIYSKHMPPKAVYRNYIQTYLERDVRLLTQVGDLNTFQTFLTLCATRIGQVVNLTALGNECRISDHTVKRWLSILEASYIIFLLPPHEKNFGKRLIKSPKLYFYDTGLACQLLRLKEDELALHPMKGHLFESLILSELYKYSYNRGDRPHFTFWRDSKDHEIDCLILANDKTIPLEVKSSRTFNPRFLEELRYWQTLQEAQSAGYIIYGASRSQPSASAQCISWQDLPNLYQQLI